MDGRLYIAEPPLYKVSDKKNPFVVDKADYVKRYVSSVIQEYKIGYRHKDCVEYVQKDFLIKLLGDTSSYASDIQVLSQHYKINDRLAELILEEIARHDSVNQINPHELVKNINEEFPEIYYDEKDKLLRGVIDSKYQLFELTERFLRKSKSLISLIRKYGPGKNSHLVLKNIKTGTEHESSLLGALKILKKYQPDIQVRLKGLGEASKEDLKTTIMDPNTRTLIKVHISDIENDMKVFQMLRGDSPIDRQNRKKLMSEFEFDVSLIDT